MNQLILRDVEELSLLKTKFRPRMSRSCRHKNCGDVVMNQWPTEFYFLSHGFSYLMSLFPVNETFLPLKNFFSFVHSKRRFLPSLTISDHLWSSLTILDHPWLSQNIFEHFWPYMTITIYDYIQPYMTIYTIYNLIWNIYDHIWLYLTIYDYRWPYITISVHLRPSQTISDNSWLRGYKETI